MKVLKLSAQGLPQSWISLEQAVLHYAADQVRWEVGAQVAVFRGGHKRLRAITMTTFTAIADLMPVMRSSFTSLRGLSGELDPALRLLLDPADAVKSEQALARHLDADPEGVLRETNLKFERRFAAIERALAARGKTPSGASLTEMDKLWDEAKAAEKAASARD